MTRPELVRVTRKSAKPGEIRSLLIALSHHFTAERFGVTYQAARAKTSILSGYVPKVADVISRSADPGLMTLVPKLEPEDAWYYSNMDIVNLGVADPGIESGILMAFVEPPAAEPA